MITAIEGAHRARVQLLLRHGGFIGMRIASTLHCYGVAHPDCHFYLVDNTSVLMTLGEGALLCGSVTDTQELESFLTFANITRFQSDRTMLAAGTIVPQVLLRYEGTTTVPAQTDARVQKAQNLWALAHSGLLGDVSPEAFYADACARVNRGVADIRIIQHENEIIATAGVYASDGQSAYISAVETKLPHRKQGCASALLASLCQTWASTHTLYLLCAPEKRRFYEKRCFVLAMPMWQFERKNNET